VQTPPQPATQITSEAPTKAPHMAAAASELPPTRPVAAPLAARGPEDTPVTALMGPQPELVGTPNSPTAFGALAASMLAAASRPPPASSNLLAAPSQPPPASGNTPTNIALTDNELESLLTNSGSTPGSGQPEPPLDDLQGVPTRVAVMRSPDSTHVGGHYGVPTAATLPLSVVSRPKLPDSSEPMYPSTLSHATGQEVNLRPRLLPPWPEVRETVLRLTGVLPRSRVRLAVTGGVLTLLLILAVVWLASGSSAPSDGKGRLVPAAGGPGREVAPGGLLADGGNNLGLGLGKDAKTGPVPGHDSGSANKAPGSSDKAGDKAGEKTGSKTPTVKPGKPPVIKKGIYKGGADAKKRPLDAFL
jgi:hypothetical protein